MTKAIMVEIFEAKPNKMWPEAMRQVVRFLRYSGTVACAECGRRSKHHWTLLVTFTAQTVPRQGFTLTSSGTTHLPLAPVCRAHLLAPVLPEDAEAPIQ